MDNGNEPSADITALLAAASQGDRSALERLMPLVYEELRRRAHRQLARGPRRGTLGTTALVHEAYIRMVNAARASWQDRNHFFGVAARAMRSVVVDYARRRLAKRRGGGGQQIELEEKHLRVDENASELVALDQALSRLDQVDGRLAKLVELRFFAGLSVEETAAVLAISERTVKRDWSKARTLLHQMLLEA